MHNFLMKLTFYVRFLPACKTPLLCVYLPKIKKKKGEQWFPMILLCRLFLCSGCVSLNRIISSRDRGKTVDKNGPSFISLLVISRSEKMTDTDSK